MATFGKDSWEKYYEGNDGVVVEVKKSAPYYGDEITSKQEGILPLKGKVIYRDIFSQHIKKGGNNKIAFQFDEPGSVYYSSVDNFRKPGGTSGIGLKPKSFGIENVTFISTSSYYNTIVDALNRRRDNGEIGGELYEYLLAVLNYAKTGTTSFNDIQKDGLPWGEITSYFGELAGPLACVSGRCSGLSQIISSPSSCKIYMPSDSVALYDYKLINSSTGAEYMISAKRGGSVSNVVKPQFVVDPLNDVTSDNSLSRLKRTLAYRVLQILADNPAKSGPFYAYQAIYPQVLTSGMISSIMSVYKLNSDSTKKIPDAEIVLPFINRVRNRHSVMTGKNPQDMTVGLLRYVCEQEIAKWSTTPTVNADLKNIFQKYLNITRVIYVKMIASASQNPSFSASSTTELNSVSKVLSVSLRTKNDSVSRVDDKVGYQVS
jgi:hypothetical protein